MPLLSFNNHSEPTPEQLKAEFFSLQNQYSEALKNGELLQAEEIFLRIKELDKHLHVIVNRDNLA